MIKWYMKHRPGCPFDFAPLDVCDCIEKNMGERIVDLEAKLAEVKAQAKEMNNIAYQAGYYQRECGLPSQVDEGKDVAISITEAEAQGWNEALREAATELEVNWGHKATPEMRDAILALIDTEAAPQTDLSGISEPQDAHRIANRIASNLFTAGWHEAAEYVLSDWMHGHIMAELGIEQEGET